MIFSPFTGLERDADSWTTRAGLLAALILATASTGCGQRACIEWSVAEGVCPSPAAVMADHIGTCTNITSVDGDGTREGDLCCYPVTKVGALPPCIDETSSSGPPPPDTSSSIGTGTFACDNQGFCGAFNNSGCSVCAQTDFCGQQFVNCQNSIPCNNILNCETTCIDFDAECKKSCEKPNPDGLALYTELTQCVYCNECRNDCSSHQAECLAPQTTSGGGMGGMSGVGGMSGKGGMGGKGGAGGAGGAGGMSGVGGAGGKGGAP